MGTIYTRTVNGINAAGTVEIEFRSTGTRQIVLDTVSWTGYSAAAAPTLTTPTATAITQTGATLGANITSDGGASLTSRGTVWGTTVNPTGNVLAEGGTATGVFTHNRTGLSQGTRYFYRGYAVNSAGNGYSPNGSFYTEPGQASSVAFSAVAGTSMTVSWTAGANSDGAIVVMRQGNATITDPTDGTLHTANAVFGSGTDLGSGSFVVYRSNGTSVNVTGLTAGNTYYVEVFAYKGTVANSGVDQGINYRQTSPATGNQATLSTSAPVLTTPTATSTTTGGATLGATITSDGGSAITSRGTVWGTTANPTGNVLAEGGTAVSAFSHARTGMGVNTLIYYRGYAINGIGTGYSSDGTFWTLANVPSAPTVSTPTATTLDVAVNVNGNPASTEFAIRTGGQYVQANGTLGASAVWQTAATWGTRTVTGLASGTTHSFDVRARNGAGTLTAFSSTASGLTIPGQPATPTAASITTTGFTVNWSATTGASSYRLDVATDSGFTSMVSGYNDLTVAGTSQAVSGLNAGETYYVRIRAVNASGTSVNSGTLTQATGCFTTGPTAEAATSVTQNSFIANWQSVVGATSYRLDVSTSSSFATAVEDDFDDGNFTADPAWSGNTANYSILTAATLPSGNASTDGSFLGSDDSVGNSALLFATSETNEWRFSLGSPNFNPSSGNHFGAVLMSDTALTGDITSASWNGYYLRLGVDGSTDYLELWRSSGASKTKVGDFAGAGNFGTGALRDGLDLRITRDSAGEFTLYYATGFAYGTTPTASGGTLTDTTHTASSYFGVYTRFANPATSRRVYIDNILLSGEDLRLPGYADLTVAGTSQSVTGLDADTTYYYRVRAFSSACGASANSATVTVTTATLLEPIMEVYGEDDSLIPNGSETTAAANGTRLGTAILSCETVDQDFTIENNGTAPLTLSTATLSGPNAGDFSIVTQPSSPVAVAGSTTFTVRFTPGAVGLRSAVVNLPSNDPAADPYTFTVSAVGWDGFDPAVAWFQGFEASAVDTWGILSGAVISTDTGSAEFPDDARIRTGSASHQVNNDTVTLDLDEIDISGYSAVTVSVHLASTSATSGNGADVSDVVRVFVALDGNAFPANPDIEIAGNNNAYWSYNSDAVVETVAGTPVNASPLGGGDRDGDGDGPSHLRIAIPDGTDSVALRIEAVNNAPGEFWNIDDIAITAIPPTAGPEIAVLGTNDLLIAYQETTTSSADGTDFGNVVESLDFVDNIFTITNSGQQTLTIGTISLTGAHAADFSVESAPSGTVAPGGATTFTLRFEPSAVGAREATVSIPNNDCNEDPYTFAVGGTGTPPAPFIRVLGTNLAEIAIGSATPSLADGTDFGAHSTLSGSQDNIFTITNSGSAALSVTGVSITGTHAADFTLLSSPAASVPVGSVTTFTVRFEPGGGGLRTATIEIEHNDGPRDPFDFDVQGTGEQPSVQFALTSTTVTEGNTVQIDVTISDSVDATVDIALGGSAVPGSGNDYLLIPASVTFTEDGPTTQSLTFTALDNCVQDGTRTATLTLASPVGVDLGVTTVHTVTILDDEEAQALFFQGFESSALDTWPIDIGSGNISTDPGASDNLADARIRTGTASWQVSDALGVLELSEVDVSGYDNLLVRARLSSTGTGTQGNDTTDTVSFFVALDGAAFALEPDVMIRGFSDQRFGYDATGIATTMAGISITNRIDTGGLITDGYATIEIEIPNGTDEVALRIEALNNRNDEFWNLDDIEVVGVSIAAPPAGTGGVVDIGETDPADTVIVQDGSLLEGEYALTNLVENVSMGGFFEGLYFNSDADHLYLAVRYANPSAVAYAEGTPETIAFYDFETGSTFDLSPDTVAANMTASEFGSLSGSLVSTTGLASTHAVLDVDWINAGDNAYTARVEVASGYALSFSGQSIVYNQRRFSNDGPTDWRVRYAVNNGAFVTLDSGAIPAGNGWSTNTVSLNAIGRIDGPAAVTFRFEAYGASSGTDIEVGDIAIIAFNAVNPDAVAFVTLGPIEEGAEIKITDRGWRANNTFYANEKGWLIWTPPAGGVEAGTRVLITDAQDTALIGASIGNVSRAGSLGADGFAMNTQGEQLIIYQGSETEPSFRYALQFGRSTTGWDADAVSSHTSAMPTGLVEGVTAIVNPFNGDNGHYTGTVFGTKSDLLSSISDPNNWLNSDIRFDDADFRPDAFTVTDAPLLGATVGNREYALDNVTVSGRVDQVTSVGSTGEAVVIYFDLDPEDALVGVSDIGNLTAAADRLQEAVTFSGPGDASTEDIAWAELADGSITNAFTADFALVAIPGAGETGFYGIDADAPGTLTPLAFAAQNSLANGVIEFAIPISSFTNFAPSLQPDAFADAFADCDRDIHLFALGMTVSNAFPSMETVPPNNVPLCGGSVVFTNAAKVRFRGSLDELAPEFSAFSVAGNDYAFDRDLADGPIEIAVTVTDLNDPLDCYLAGVASSPAPSLVSTNPAGTPGPGGTFGVSHYAGGVAEVAVTNTIDLTSSVNTGLYTVALAAEDLLGNAISNFVYTFTVYDDDVFGPSAPGTLLHDTFADGNWTNGSDPADTDWFTQDGTLTLFLDEDLNGIGSTNALFVVPPNGGSLVGAFPSVTLTDVDDYVSLAFYFRLASSTEAQEAFRFGLYHDNGTAVAADQDGNAGDDEGYHITLPSGTAEGLSAYVEAGGSQGPTTGTDRSLLDEDVDFTYEPTDPHRVELFLTRGEDEVLLTLWLNGERIFETADSADVFTNFNQVVFSAAENVPFIVDNIAVMRRVVTVVEGSAWTNSPEFTVQWETGTAYDPTGVQGFRLTTNAPQTLTSDPQEGLNAGFFDEATLVVNGQGRLTNFLFGVDADNDRPGDAARGYHAAFVVRVDTTPPDQLAAPEEVPAEDPLTTVALRWPPAGDPGELRDTNDDLIETLSPWDTYRVYFADEVLPCAEEGWVGAPCSEEEIEAFFVGQPFIDALDDPDLATMEGVYDDAEDQNFVSTLIPDLVPGVDYTFAVAGRDRAGNRGPLSPPIVVPTQDFYITNAVAISATEARFEIRTALNREYDLLRVDATDYGDQLTNFWVSAFEEDGYFIGNSNNTRTIQSKELPFSFVTNTVSGQPRSQIRFMRAAPRHAWTNGRPFRIASPEIYMMKQTPLRAGDNWVALPGLPDSNRVDMVLGTYLPAGSGPLAATRATWFERGGAQTSTNSIWLVDSNPPRWTSNGSDDVNDTPLPLHEGFIIRLPTTASPTDLLLVGRVPLTNQVQTLAENLKYNLISLRTPRSLHPSELFSPDDDPASGNFTGGALPIPNADLGSDMLWKYDRNNQRVQNIVYYNTNLGKWLLDSGAEVPENYFQPDDAIIFFSGRSTESITITNQAALLLDGSTNGVAPWRVPTINMTP